MRTFYPVFLNLDNAPANGGDAAPPTVLIADPGATATTAFEDKVKIIAALVNPAGHDVNAETVTLINVSPETIDLTGWRLLDKNQNAFPLEGVIAPDETRKFVLRNGMQLSNNGGRIQLQDAAGVAVDQVTYTKQQVRRQGWGIVFA